MHNFFKARAGVMLNVLWMTLINSFLVLLICFRYFRHLEPADSWLRWLYVPTSILGYTFMLMLAWLAICAVLSTWRRLVYVVSVLFFSLVVTMLAIDTFVYDIYRYHLSPFFVSTFFTEFSDFGFTFGTAAAIIGIPVLVVGAQALLLRLIVRRTAVWAGHSRWGLGLAAAMIACFVVGQTIHAWAFEYDYSPVTSITPHLPMYYPIRAHRLMARLHMSAPAAERKDKVGDRRGDNIHRAVRYPLSPLTFKQTNGTPSILLIALEGWRFDTLEAAIMPNVHKFAVQSCVFDHHYSGGTVTTCGFFSMYYGLAPTYWSIVGANPSAIGPPLILDEARRRNYQFLLMSTSELERFKQVQTIFQNNRSDLHVDTRGTSWERDARMTSQFIDFLRSGRDSKRPFFVMLSYRSSHYNYYYPPDYPEVFTPTRQINYATVNKNDDPVPYRNRYKNSLHYLDMLIGRVLDFMKTSGELENTIVIITGDHGEEFNENKDNYWGHGSNFTRHQVQTPLVLYWPGRLPQRFSHPTSHMDIAPTLMSDAFDCTSPIESYSSGRNLFDQSQRPGISVGSYVNYAFIVDDCVYALYPGYIKQYSVNDIRKPAPNPPVASMKYFLTEKSRFLR